MQASFQQPTPLWTLDLLSSPVPVAVPTPFFSAVAVAAAGNVESAWHSRSSSWGRVALVTGLGEIFEVVRGGELVLVDCPPALDAAWVCGPRQAAGSPSRDTLGDWGPDAPVCDLVIVHSVDRSLAVCRRDGLIGGTLKGFVGAQLSAVGVGAMGECGRLCSDVVVVSGTSVIHAVLRGNILSPVSEIAAGDVISVAPGGDKVALLHSSGVIKWSMLRRGKQTLSTKTDRGLRCLSRANGTMVSITVESSFQLVVARDPVGGMFRSHVA